MQSRHSSERVLVSRAKNPIIQLNEQDRALLHSLLMVYASSASPKHVASYEPLDTVHEQMADAAKLCKRLESEVFGGPNSEMLLPYTEGFQDLPSRIAEFSTRLKEGILTVGKPGYQQDTFANSLFVRALELVRLRTGRHNDEHLAGLFQRLAANGDTPAKDLSGNAIRKKRIYLKANYPASYASAEDDMANV